MAWATSRSSNSHKFPTCCVKLSFLSIFPKWLPSNLEAALLSLRGGLAEQAMHCFSLPLISMFRDFDWIVSESCSFQAGKALSFETFSNTADAVSLDHPASLLNRSALVAKTLEVRHPGSRGAPWQEHPPTILARDNEISWSSLPYFLFLPLSPRFLQPGEHPFENSKAADMAQQGKQISFGVTSCAVILSVWF